MKPLSSRFCLGIDTGGTYTDAVILDLEASRVIGTSKQPTTHYDLAVGIGAALDQVLRRGKLDPKHVSLVTVSSTLATNAVVEDKKAAVGMILIGFPEYVNLPAACIKYIRGGHTLKGDEQEPLDVPALAEAVEDLRDKVDACAVCSLMSVVNPTHELVAAKTVEMLHPVPVFCSHQISGKFGIKERAATTLLNAGLVPVMSRFLDGVRTSLAAAGIDAPLLVVRGDARAVAAANALSAPAATVMSGPAASAFFGARSAPDSSALVVDVGGTTTDVCLVHDGLPVVTGDGSVIGHWQTHINTVESFTVGVGGDSAVWVNSGAVGLSAERVHPIILHPELSNLSSRLRDNAEPRAVVATLGQRTALANRDAVLHYLCQNGSATAEELRIAVVSDSLSIAAHLRELKKHQLVAEVGFTPTDALQVLGQLELGDSQPALRLAESMARRCGKPVEQFCEEVLAVARRKIENSLLDHVIRREVGLDLASFLARRGEHKLLDVTMKLNVPVVGLGAAAPLLLRGIGEALGAEVVFPEHYPVGNAMGAVLMGVEAFHLPSTAFEP